MGSTDRQLALRLFLMLCLGLLWHAVNDLKGRITALNARVEALERGAK